MQKFLAQLFSYLFHPLLMPTLGTVLMFNSENYMSTMVPTIHQYIIYGIVFVTTFVIPLTIVPFLMMLKIISTPQIEDQKERILPMIITSICFYFAYFLLSRMPFQVPYFTRIFILTTSIAVCFSIFITMFWKISLHMVGIGGVVGLILALSLDLDCNMISHMIVLVFLSGLTGFARLYLNAHSPAQVYSGFALGFFTTLFVVGGNAIF